MSVFRVKHNANYVCINKLALEDPNLSLKAKGLWAYCMSRPDDWTFRLCHLESIMKEGKDAIKTAITELIAKGYCKRVTVKNSKGQFQSTDYVIYEVPNYEEVTVKLKEKVLRKGFPLVAKTPLLSNDNTKYISPPSNAVAKTQQHSSSLPKAEADVVASLKKSFKKSLKGEQVDRAVAFYLSHPKVMKLADNPIGYAIHMVKNNLDCEDGAKITIIYARKQWAKDHEYNCPAGCAIAQNEAYCVIKGGITTEYRYNNSDPFWEKHGLAFPV